MKCCICKQDAVDFSPKYQDKVCMTCQEMFDESDKKRRVFMEKYKKDHECCPICGSTRGITTLVGFIYNSENPEKYKDENNFTCGDCGDQHVAHDRVPVRT